MDTKQILLIDDDTNVREVVSACLRKLGDWDVCSTSAQAGLDTTQITKFDAVVLNVMTLDTPGIGMDEVELLQQLERASAAPLPPIILLTEKFYSINAKLLLKPRVVTAIANPFKPVSLIKQIAQAMNWGLQKREFLLSSDRA